MQAYALLEQLRGGDKSEATLAKFNAVRQDLSYGLLLKKYSERIVDASEVQIKLASLDTLAATHSGLPVAAASTKSLSTSTLPRLNST